MQPTKNDTSEPLQERFWHLLIIGRPLHHSESYDSVNYALFAENSELGELGTAPDC